MTTELDRLIEAVEAGHWVPVPTNERHAVAQGTDGWSNITYAQAAYHGDLNAAVTLLEALLPGWDWWVNSRHYWDKSEGPLALIKTGRPGVDLKVVDAKSENPARALLLATLRAYRSAREGA